MTPARCREIFDAFHTAAGQQLRRGRGGGERVNESPVLRERGVGRGERTCHHRTGGKHAAFPGESLHLPTDGGSAAQSFDRHGGIG